jgi:hypothetical protein
MRSSGIGSEGLLGAAGSARGRSSRESEALELARPRAAEMWMVEWRSGEGVYVRRTMLLLAVQTSWPRSG